MKLGRSHGWVGAEGLLQSRICIGTTSLAPGISASAGGGGYWRSSHLSLSLALSLSWTLGLRLGLSTATNTTQKATQSTQIKAVALVAKAGEFGETLHEGLELSCNGCCSSLSPAKDITHLRSDSAGEIGNGGSIGAIENVEHLDEFFTKSFGDNALLGGELGGGFVLGSEGGRSLGIDNGRLDAVDLLGLVDCRRKGGTERKIGGQEMSNFQSK